MIRREVAIQVTEGLHARPAAEFARICAESGVDVLVRRTDGKTANGASILAIMTLGLRMGDIAIIEAPDSAETLVENLVSLLG
jgi:phosphotransferase system HPr (HPr) family protein